MSSDTRRASVLIVEDDHLVRIVAAEVFKEEGYEVVEASDALDALRKLKHQGGDVSLLVTDVDMPGLIDGVKLAQIVSLSWPHVSILVCSGHSGLSRTWELPHIAAFLPKPYRAVSLLDLAKQLTGSDAEERT